jgi:probable rRNA maturation factor
MSDSFVISVANQQSQHAVDEPLLRRAAREVLNDSPYSSATISIAVVDDALMRELNRRFLGHDWPTDVLSFVLQQLEDHLEGEVVLSAETAAAAAAELRWPANAEQLLYLIHGMLHLVGYGDKTPAESRRMRQLEAEYLRRFGLVPPHETPGSPPTSPKRSAPALRGGTKAP